MPTADQKITTVWGSFMGVMVQAYFIHRGFVLSNNWYFLVAASVCALVGLIGSIIFVRALRHDYSWLVVRTKYAVVRYCVHS